MEFPRIHALLHAQGSEATPELVAGGAAAAAALHKYEGAPVAHHVAQGAEPQPLLQALHLGRTSPPPRHRSDLDADFKVCTAGSSTACRTVFRTEFYISKDVLIC